jgi:hypothetical protein
MNKEAKIHLSALELELVNNTQWIFTKQIVIKKVQHLLGDLHDHYRKVVEEEKEFLPEIFRRAGGKITRGENYRGLPYLILDYPALFGKEDIFAVRTMFWWGNFFSISLHVSGKYFSCRENIWQLLDALKKKNFWVCVNENEWEHHFQPHNYCMIHEMTEHQINDLNKKDFLKFGKKIELTAWDSIPLFLEQSFKEIIELIKVNFPSDEKVL